MYYEVDLFLGKVLTYPIFTLKKYQKIPIYMSLLISEKTSHLCLLGTPD